MSVIALKNVSKVFGRTTAVHNVSFNVEEGEVVGFVGPNGAGKTTTISMLMGFIRPSHGQLALLDRPVQPQTAHQQHAHIGFAAGDMAMFYNLRGKQYLDFLAHLNHVTPSARDQLVAELQPVLHKPLKQLSRGNKQKIALIGALQHEPTVIILDEPTSGLDPLMQSVFLQLISKAQQRGATVLMSSHILSEVAYSCDRVLFMKHGEIIMNRDVAELEKQRGKIVTLQADMHTLQTVANNLPEGAFEAKQAENKLHFRFTGEAKPLLMWLNSIKTLNDVAITEQNLDDIFYELYKDEEQTI